MAICYVDDTSLQRNARPVMHWLLANAYVFLVTICNMQCDVLFSRRNFCYYIYYLRAIEWPHAALGRAYAQPEGKH